MRIHIFGGSGCGITTLGVNLAAHFKIPAFDADDYYWKPTDPPYSVKNTIAERHHLLNQALGNFENWILTGSMDSWGEPFQKQFQAVLFLTAPRELRLQRLRQRETQKFGDRIKPGGDMYLNHAEFVEWAAGYESGALTGRSLPRHEAWMKTLRCSVLRLDSSVDQNQLVSNAIDSLKKVGLC